jgi:hypothetical protein
VTNNFFRFWRLGFHGGLFSYKMRCSGL